MVWAAFKSFYYIPDGIAWAAWNPQLHHRKSETANETVSIPQAAQRYAPSDEVNKRLNQLITQEVYSQLISKKLDIPFLEKRGFRVIKDTGTRVFFHQDYKDWLIKVGVSSTRSLPMASSVKCLSTPAEKRETVYKPIRNINLLRAPGREFFKNQLRDANVADPLFHFPKERIYTCPHAEPGAKHHQKYFSISQRQKTYSPGETVAILKNFSETKQRETAQKFIQFIMLTRIHDNTPGNLVLRKDLKHVCFEVLDSEPIGVLMDSDDKGDHLFEPKEHILHALITFRDHYCRANGLIYMAEVADRAIIHYLEKNPDISVDLEQKFIDALPATTCQQVEYVSLILASILCPLLPLAFLVGALFMTYIYHPDPMDPHNHYRFISEDTPGLAALRARP